MDVWLMWIPGLWLGVNGWINAHLWGFRNTVVPNVKSVNLFLWPLVVHEEASYAGTGHRRGETGHQTLLSEKGHNKRGIQRDLTEGCSEGMQFTWVVFIAVVICSSEAHDFLRISFSIVLSNFASSSYVLGLSQ